MALTGTRRRKEDELRRRFALAYLELVSFDGRDGTPTRYDLMYRAPNVPDKHLIQFDGLDKLDEATNDPRLLAYLCWYTRFQRINGEGSNQMFQERVYRTKRDYGQACADVAEYLYRATLADNFDHGAKLAGLQKRQSDNHDRLTHALREDFNYEKELTRRAGAKPEPPGRDDWSKFLVQ